MNLKDLNELLKTNIGVSFYQEYLSETEKQAFIGQSYNGYKIEDFVNEGSSGLVYKAHRDDGQFNRTVAIKFLSPGIVTDDMQFRFFTERKILASLTHPNIAQLYDAGITESGIPYFIMEYVEGQHLDDYCRSNPLDIEQKLTLIKQLAEAVGFAHDRGIIHRDIKPANVLVTSDGVPKLLDFSIADANEFEEPSGDAENCALTFRFASPEQILAQEISIRSDIYQLGGLFFYLLSGQHVFEGDSKEQLVDFHRQQSKVALVSERLKERENVDLSTVKKVQGDLDAIVDKCLMPEAQSRYSSAYEFIDDINRHQDGLPIKAREHSMEYRIGRYITKNRYWVMGAFGFLFSLFTVSLLYTLELNQAKNDIEREAVRANRVIQLIGNLFESSSPFGQSGEKPTVESLIAKAEQQVLNDLIAEPEVAATLYGILGKLQLELDQFEHAERLIQLALDKGTEKEKIKMAALLSRLYFESGKRNEAYLLAETQVNQLQDRDTDIEALIWFYLVKAEELVERRELESARAVIDKILSFKANSPAINRLHAKAYVIAANSYKDEQRWQEQLEQLDKAEQILLEIGDKNPYHFSLFKIQRARINSVMGNFKAAQEVYLEVLDIYQNIGQGMQDDVAHVYNLLAEVNYRQGNYQASLDYLLKSREILIDIYGPKHVKINAINGNLPMLYAKLGLYQKAIEFSKASVREAESYTEDGQPYRDYVNSLFILAGNYSALSQYDKATYYYQKAIDSVAGRKDSEASILRGKVNLALQYCNAKQTAKGISYFNEAGPGFIKVLGDSVFAKVSVNTIKGICHYQSGEYDLALAQHQENWQLFVTKYGDGVKNSISSNTQYYIAKTLCALGQYQQAQEHLASALAWLESVNSTQSVEYFYAKLLRARIFVMTNQIDKAKPDIDYVSNALSKAAWHSPELASELKVLRQQIEQI